MKSLRPANTMQVVIAVSFAAALALGSLWLVEVTQRKSDDMLPQAARTEPDFYVEKFNFVRMGKTGEARYKLVGDEMKHYPMDNSYHVQKPVMHSFGEGRSPMISTSERAIVKNDNTEVHMYDNVHIDRPASATAQHFELRSSYLLLLPDEDIMRTPKPVQLKLGGSILNGTGMVANNATGEFNLSGDVRGMYQPATRRN